jgi:hypothetical protein
MRALARRTVAGNMVKPVNTLVAHRLAEQVSDAEDKNY